MNEPTAWPKVWEMLIPATGETALMVGLSTFFAMLGGLPLGILLHMSAPGGLHPKRLVHRVLGVIVDFTRSMPFIILLLILIPVTQLIVGTYIGSVAATVPLTIGAIPFVGRLVQTALGEVDARVVESAITTGAGTWRIVRSVLLREAAPALFSSGGVTCVALIGYSAMAGAVGGGGLGQLAIAYGYQRFDNRVLYSAVIVLALFTMLLQLAFTLASRAVDRRRRITV